MRDEKIPDAPGLSRPSTQPSAQPQREASGPRLLAGVVLLIAAFAAVGVTLGTSLFGISRFVVSIGTFLVGMMGSIFAFTGNSKSALGWSGILVAITGLSALGALESLSIQDNANLSILGAVAIRGGVSCVLAVWAVLSLQSQVHEDLSA